MARSTGFVNLATANFDFHRTKTNREDPLQYIHSIYNIILFEEDNMVVLSESKILKTEPLVSLIAQWPTESEF